MHEDDGILLRRSALRYEALDIHLVNHSMYAAAILLRVRSLNQTCQTTEKHIHSRILPQRRSKFEWRVPQGCCLRS